ncbi:LLM class flavin-dependent oxidoreductase [Actinoplanes sp. NPDC051513]|uniref:LLM class flavin-dependent oxidoreductase n=1 Tax=Actinoplanes sp. NPDC051513 TaxID=3363908 RepID=UPI0037ADE527
MATTSSPRPRLKIGIGLPTLGERGRLGSLEAIAAARHVEALGFDAVVAADLILGDGTPTLEAMVVLAAATAATERVGIEFGVLNLPLRPVVWVAAQVQALQHLSGNRVVLGVGSGGIPDLPFWGAVAVAGRERGKRTDSALAVLPQLIAGKPTRLPDQSGQPIVTLAPAAPVPPLLVGGNSDVAIRRAATSGDGWYPSQITPNTLASGVAKLRQATADREHADPVIHVGGFTIQTGEESVRAARPARESFVRSLPGNHGISPEEATAMVIASPAEAAELFAAYAEAGADSISVSPGIGTAGANWMRRCELVAEAHRMMA